MLIKNIKDMEDKRNNLKSAAIPNRRLNHNPVYNTNLSGLDSTESLDQL